jgi:uncharacterized protein (TIGR02466 family)
VNAELAQHIRGLRAQHASERVANAGGWHSGSGLFETNLPAIATLKGWVGEAIQGMVNATMELPEVSSRRPAIRGGFRLTAWANIIERGHYHRHHNHPGSAWSGVYYVNAQPPEPGSLSGILELFDPRAFTEMTDVPGSPYGQRVLVRPEPGLMVLFPGWLYHFVHPLQHDGERISIAFNAAWHPEGKP